MTSFLSDNWGNIIVLSLVAAAVIFAVRAIIRDKKAGKCSGCPGCTGCDQAGKCPSSGAASQSEADGNSLSQ